MIERRQTLNTHHRIEDPRLLEPPRAEKRIRGYPIGTFCRQRPTARLYRKELR